MPRSLVALAAALALASAALLPPAPAVEDQPGGQVEVGFGEADVTPKVDPKGKPVYLAGFGQNRKATGVNDHLFARAVVVRDGKAKVALVSVDVVGLFNEFVQNVRKRLPGFTYVVVSSTHNHEGPDTLGLWGPSPLQSGVDPDYMALLEKQIVRAVTDADAACRPATARIGTVKAPELLHDGRLPIVLHDDLVVLHFQEAKGGKNLGLLVQWNCHPETLGSGNKLVSADYVGYAVKHLRERHGCPVAYFTGTVGGLMTSLHVPIKSAKGEDLKDGTYEKTSRYGELLAAAADKAVAAAKPLALAPVAARSRAVYFPMANKAYVGLSQLGVLPRAAYRWTGDPYEAAPAKEADDPKKTPAVRSEVAHLRLGELDVACIPGEIYPELVLDKVVEKAEPGADFPDAPREPGVYAQLKGPHRMILGLANDEIGYIIPKRQWDDKPPFAYGKKKAQYGEINSLGPETAPILCRAFKELVEGKK
jgi:hypothetical protein